MGKEETWIQEVLASTEGMQRAKPARDLLSSIEQRIQQTGAKIIPMRRLRMAAAAAILLLMMNVVALNQYADYTAVEEILTESEMAEPSLISNFNLYE